MPRVCRVPLAICCRQVDKTFPLKVGDMIHTPSPKLRLVTPRHLALVEPDLHEGISMSVPLTLADLASAVMITVNAVRAVSPPTTSVPSEFVWVLARGTGSAIRELVGIRITVTPAAVACFSVHLALRDKQPMPKLSPPRMALVKQ